MNIYSKEVTLIKTISIKVKFGLDIIKLELIEFFTPLPISMAERIIPFLFS